MKIMLYGEIVSDEWEWVYSLFQIPHCCPKQVREAIEQLPAGEDLILEINSPGGNVWAGFEIFGLLQACSAHTEAHIIALAASAATTVCSGCDTVLSSPVAQIMIHQPAVPVEDYMNNEDTKRLQNFLDSVKASIINGYVVKSGGKATRRTFEKLVDQSTYMPVQDAMDLGLVDGLLDADDELQSVITAAGGVVVTNAVGASLAPTALLKRYEAAVRAGTMEEVPGHPVTKEAAQALSGAPLAASGAPANLADDAGTVNNRVTDWRLQAAIDLERVRA
ncbi:MAG: Clp protease ClpP [Eubacteriales bacterium]|nr:Clp protease ClpP [Eubacteriales bacterium]